MTDLVSLGADVDWPDHAAATAVRDAVGGRNSVRGRLDELAEWVAGAQGARPPHDFRRVRAVVFGTAEPGVAVVSAADLVGAGVRAVPATGSPEPDPAADVTAAVAEGAALADAEIDAGADLLVVAYPGQHAGSAVLVSIVTNTEPVKVMPRGAHLPPAEWMATAERVRDSRRRAFAHRDDPAALLRLVAGRDLAVVTGFVLQAAVRRTPVLLDGLQATVAAVLAYEAQPRAVRWWRAADLSPDPAHELAQVKLGMQPLLDLGMRRPDGTAGLLAAALLRAAVRTLPAPTAVDGSADV